ncbi:MAG TPA: hypothetical protein PLL00_02255 [Bacteroidia bacterium]|jgi:hypothetical protein|nr:hypothetical protein [Bacteroidia bacterium]
MNDTASITVSDKYKIHTIKEKFNIIFPYLRIELFSSSTNSSSFSEKNSDLEKFRLRGNTDTIIISPKMTVSDLEMHFKNIYGLMAQVYRKSGKIWLETTVTDSWTLEEQNKQGESLSKNSPH